jgi:hypothetical protein
MTAIAHKETGGLMKKSVVGLVPGFSSMYITFQWFYSWMKFPVRKTGKQMCHHRVWQCYKDLKNTPLLHPPSRCKKPGRRSMSETGAAKRECHEHWQREGTLLCYPWNRKESVMSIDEEKGLLCYLWNRKESVMKGNVLLFIVRTRNTI